MHVKKTKELDDNSPTKNDVDVKDAHVIARLVQGARYSEPNLLEGIHAELRIAMNMRERINRDLSRTKGRVTTWLDRYFPEFWNAFKDWEGKAAIQTLKYFCLPQDIKRMTEDQIVTVWKQEVKRAVGASRAKRLLAAAKASIGLTEGLELARMELQLLLEQYTLLQKQCKQLEEKIQELLEHIPGTREMQTIPGVSFLTVAGFLAEVGDLQKYEHPNQIQKLAGLNLKEYSSGKHKGKTQITKRGRPRLRALLFRSVMPLVAKNKEFQAFHRHFTTRWQNPLQKKQSLIALSCKLIRILFHLGREQVTYDPMKIQQTLQRIASQEVA